MPISVKDYEWSETLTEVQITVPLKGVAPGKVDILSTDTYVKVSYPPFLFEVIYYDEVNEAEGQARVGNGVVQMTLKKKESGLWSRLAKPTATDAGSESVESGEKPLTKEEIQKLREQALDDARERAQLADKQKRERKDEERREAVKRQIDADDVKKEEKAAARKAVIDEAMTELDEWREQQARENAETGKNGRHGSARPATSTASSVTAKSGKKSQKRGDEPTNGGKHGALPPVRQSGRITVSFTPRSFTTPMRESKVDEEEAWLKKQRDAAKSQQDFDDENKDLEERDPLWLKDKGNAFYKQGNYQSAVNVYTFAIRKGGKMPALYSNRAACHMHLQDYERCIKDCFSAMDLLEPPVEDNRMARVKVLARRGAALAKLDLLAEALKDYQEALKLDPSNAALSADEQRLRSTIQGSTA
ncbi:dynein axonemal assembly factor 4-like [Sycon ciliatum]|uniref:dynein axonemal assembly factor 4-like n=1 Tax=Sycon ciliatum TaxID=27933 RepID=UPI0031F6EDEA|eukprot:scpid67356/ scgid12489/ Dyslexia susceptibility 1 candidate gene 1 protein homolog